jgi:hypothetical protein
LCYDSFLPDAFQFIIYQLSWHLKLYSLVTESVLNCSAKKSRRKRDGFNFGPFRPTVPPLNSVPQKYSALQTWSLTALWYIMQRCAYFAKYKQNAASVRRTNCPFPVAQHRLCTVSALLVLHTDSLFVITRSFVICTLRQV